LLYTRTVQTPHEKCALEPLYGELLGLGMPKIVNYTLRAIAHILHHGLSSAQVSHGDTICTHSARHCCMDCHCTVSSCYTVSTEFNYINESRSYPSNSAILLRPQFPNHSIMVYFIHSHTIYCCVCQFMRNSILRLSSTRIVSLLPP
jgi:hypothetical protein